MRIGALCRSGRVKVPISYLNLNGTVEDIPYLIYQEDWVPSEINNKIRSYIDKLICSQLIGV